MSIDVIFGWVLGFVSSIATSIVMFYLEGRRENRRMVSQKRLDDSRIAFNWKQGDTTMSLRGFDLTGAKLSGKNFAKADLEDSILDETVIWGADFSDSNLRQVAFKSAKIHKSSFRNAVLHSANFENATLDTVDFSGAILRGADFSKAKSVVNCTWDGIQLGKHLNENTKLPKGVLDKIRDVSGNATQSRPT